MQCFYHHGKDAVDACEDCSKRLCQECASTFTPCLCLDCYSERRKTTTIHEALRLFGKSVAFFAIAFICQKLLFSFASVKMDTSLLLVSSLIYSGIPWGWSFVSRIFPVQILGGSTGFLLLYFMLKLVAAYLIGLIIMLWNVGKICYLLIRSFMDKKEIEKIRANLLQSTDEDKEV